MFITTANQRRADPAAVARPHGDHQPGRLHDRREAAITPKDYLAPRQIEANGLTTANVKFEGRRSARDHSAVYTRRGRCAQFRCARSGSVCPQSWRAWSAETASARSQSTSRRCTETARQPRMYSEVKRRTPVDAGRGPPAWPGRRRAATFSSLRRLPCPAIGQLIVTGQLGDVMKESAQAPMSYVRAHSLQLGVADDYFQTHDIHIHVPGRAIPKDGPSGRRDHGHGRLLAGHRHADHSEIRDDRRGHSDRPGAADRRSQGKDTGAQRAGIIPSSCLPQQVDLETCPRYLRKTMTFIPVDRVRAGVGGGHELAHKRRPAGYPRPPSRPCGAAAQSQSRTRPTPRTGERKPRAAQPAAHAQAAAKKR